MYARCLLGCLVTWRPDPSGFASLCIIFTYNLFGHDVQLPFFFFSLLRYVIVYLGMVFGSDDVWLARLDAEVIVVPKSDVMVRLDLRSIRNMNYLLTYVSG